MALSPNLMAEEQRGREVVVVVVVVEELGASPSIRTRSLT